MPYGEKSDFYDCWGKLQDGTYGYFRIDMRPLWGKQTKPEQMTLFNKDFNYGRHKQETNKD